MTTDTDQPSKASVPNLRAQEPCRRILRRLAL